MARRTDDDSNRKSEMPLDDDARQSTFDAADEFIARLRDSAIWKQQSATAPSQTRVNELVAFKQRLAEEEEAAAALIEKILQQPSAWWRAALGKASGGRTAGVARLLLTRMRELIERTPTDSLLLTTLACEIADSLSVADYPSDFVVCLRAQALRDRASVLSFIGRFHEAQKYADRAEGLFRQTPVPDYELARLDLTRSSIYRSIDRVDEAIALAARASATFLRFGDRKAYVNARVTEGAMLFQKRSFAEALEVWQSVEQDPALTDDTARVGLVHNLGICHRELGHLEEAATRLHAATAEFEMLGHEVSVVRSRWALGSVLAASARYDEAVPVFRTAWREFEALGMEADAALVALELVEVLLITNRRDQVPAICRTLLDRFTRAGMAERAITALAFLRETVATGHATPAHVRHVHDFLRDVPAEGERLHAQPPLGSFES